MPQAISIPPLIPLPENQPQTKNEEDDLYSTLFSPATPRASPTLPPIPNNVANATASRPTFRHTRTSSIDSDFGSFVSVPSTEDPLSQLASGSDVVPLSPFSPLQNFEFFDKFAEGAKAATEKNKKGFLEELLRHEDDPLYFLRAATPTINNSEPEPISKPDSELSIFDLLERSRSPSAADGDLPAQPLRPTVTGLPTAQDRSTPDLLRFDTEDRLWTPPLRAGNRAEPPLMTSDRPPSSTPSPKPDRKAMPPNGGLLHELLEHQDDPMYFHASTSRSGASTPIPGSSRNNSEPLLDLGSSSDDADAQRRTHPTRRSNWTEPTSAYTRSPPLPPTAMRPSVPEVQRAQSYFMPSAFSPSSFPTRWVSSLLSRPAPSSTPPPDSDTHPRAATLPAPITHGTPFAAQQYVPPSGAPGFVGDRAWNKGFEFDKDNIERVSVRLVGRKESTTPVLTVGLADKIRSNLPALKRLPRSWTLLYSLDQHGISLNTLYTRCETFMGGTLVVMKDSNDALFGAWMTEGIKQSKGAYYGSGESFLWKVLPDEKVQVFKWTGKNDYVALCEPEYISFGGGDGHYGLYLDDTLSDGSSAPCPTFDNEPLCSAGPRQGEGTIFECVALEVWGVG